MIDHDLARRAVLKGLVAAAAASFARPALVRAAPPNVFVDKLAALEKASGGRLGVYAFDFNANGGFGWRQDEQTFDAVRGEAKFGPVTLDGTYAISQRTIFGIDAGPRQSYDGTFIFGSAAVKAGSWSALVVVTS